MGAKIPEQVAETSLSRDLEKAGLKLVYRGKVRDTYALPYYPNLLLMIATDRLSIFDFVLPCLVPEKGRVLTEMTVFWLNHVLCRFPHHLVVRGKEGGEYFPFYADASSRALVVRKVDIIPVECIVRGYLTGSGWKAHQKNGIVCGHALPSGLCDGAKLPKPIFTPSTKAETGHDEHVTAESVRIRFGPEPEEMSLAVYKAIAECARERGIVLADTKFELGRRNSTLVLADEVGTPDSSRFWDLKEWEVAVVQGKSPTGYDKEPVRQWGKTVQTPFLSQDSKPIVGIDKLDPENPSHLDFVANLKVPQEVVDNATKRYLEILRRLTG